ncbi:hypothetical protein MLD38_000386 [Melastoma candidum]|uniref:Uncharacterized protein n=1 Tax=Melastoma candidum TaxID=119954 RepID=A0ACB9SDU1_9MYRT|nr:hypothetical protein MLD38_000386 [Melastoma candidum]
MIGMDSHACKPVFPDTSAAREQWLTDFGACSGGWARIKCAQGQVIVLQLPWKNLGGRLTEKIEQFQALRKLSLHDNVIGGPIPFALGFLPNLRGVQLFNNRFAGSIPPSLSGCPLLQTLDVSNNSLTRSIPESLANCTKLYRLNVSFNSISGSVPFGVISSPSFILLARAGITLCPSLDKFLCDLAAVAAAAGDAGAAAAGEAAAAAASDAAGGCWDRGDECCGWKLKEVFAVIVVGFWSKGQIPLDLSYLTRHFMVPIDSLFGSHLDSSYSLIIRGSRIVRGDLLGPHVAFDP